MDTQGLFFCVLSHISAASLVSYCLPCIWWFSLKILCYLKDNNILRIWHFHSLPLHHSLFFCVSSDIYILQICIPGSSFQVTFSNFFFSPERNFLWIHNSKVSTSIFSCYCCAVTKLYLFVTPWSAACQASLSLTNSHSLLTHVHWVSDAIKPSHLFSSPCPPVFYFSQHQVISNELALPIRWPQYWSFSISPSNEYSGLISFRMDFFDLLAVQRILKVFNTTRVLEHQFFGAQTYLWFKSHICTWLLEKPHSLEFVGKVMTGFEYAI